MLREVVESSSLKSVGYDRARRVLEVEFQSGAVYVYSDVPATVWAALRGAPSKGKFFQDTIRERFAYERR